MDDLDGFIEKVRSLASNIGKGPRFLEEERFAVERSHALISMLPELAKKKSVEPGALLSYLVREFGKKFVRENLDLADVAAEFGTAEATRWRELLG